MCEASRNGQTLTFTVMLEAVCRALPIKRASDGLALAIPFLLLLLFLLSSRDFKSALPELKGIMLFCLYIKFDHRSFHYYLFYFEIFYFIFFFQLYPSIFGFISFSY
jgi:hypothetical protein